MYAAMYAPSVSQCACISLVCASQVILTCICLVVHMNECVSVCVSVGVYVLLRARVRACEYLRAFVRAYESGCADTSACAIMQNATSLPSELSYYII